MNYCKKNGFTLIEMMVVVALIAILAAIALPAYNNYVNRAKIKTAQADLVALSLNFENEYQRKLTYRTTAVANTIDLKAAFNGWSPASATGDFTFAHSNATSTTYTVTATGAGGGVNGCIISLTHLGVKTISACPYATGGDWL